MLHSYVLKLTFFAVLNVQNCLKFASQLVAQPIAQTLSDLAFSELKVGRFVFFLNSLKLKLVYTQNNHEKAY